MRRLFCLLSAFLLFPLGCGPPDTAGCVWISVLYLGDQPTTQPTSLPATNPTAVPAQYEYNSGSGIVFGKSDSRWYVLTSAHLVPPDHTYIVVDGCPAEFVGRLIECDLAVLSFESDEKYPSREFAIGKPGQTAWLIGYPDIYGGRPFVCRVNICAEADEHIAWNGGTVPGMSGAPLLDDCGRVLGISTGSISIRGNIFDSFGLGVSSRYIKYVFGE